MNKIFLLIVAALFGVAAIHMEALAGPADTLLIGQVPSNIGPIPSSGPRATTFITAPLDKSTYHFSGLDEEIASHLAAAATTPPPQTDPGFATDFMLKLGKANQSQNVKKAKEICDKAIQAGRFIDKLTGGNLESMPIVKKQKLGNTDIFIVFQSAKIYPTYAIIEVYVKIDLKRKDFTGQDAVLYFGAKNIYFSQDKGLIAGAVLLLSDYAIKVGETNNKAGILIKQAKQLGGQNTQENPLDDTYSGTYVLFDCDGFKQMGVGAHIFFSREWVIPTDVAGNPRPVMAKDSSNTPRVNGFVQFDVQDMDDWYVNLGVDHFVLSKWDKMSFFVGDAHLDFSSLKSPQGTPYPYVSNPLWEGLYIKSIGITLPKPFKRTNNSFAGANGINNGQAPPPRERVKVQAEHLLIEAAGVSGIFNISSQVPLLGGALVGGEWGMSMDSIGVKVLQSNMVGFGIRGELGVPILSKDGPLGYRLKWEDINGQDTYTMDVSFDARPKTYPIWNALNVTMTKKTISLMLENEEEFKATFKCDASLTIGNPSDYKGTKTGSLVEMPNGLYLTDLALSTHAPHITVGSVTLNAANSKVAGFPVTINNVGIQNGSNPNQTHLVFSLLVRLMDSNSNVAQATGSFRLKGKYERDANGARHWVYDDFSFDGASILINLPQFYCFGANVSQAFKNG